MERIDEIDVKILSLLQANGRMKRNAIAEEVGLSVPSVSERMRKLEERGVLVGYHAVVDAKRLHFDITAFIRVMVDGSGHYATMIDQASSMDEVLEMHSITGEGLAHPQGAHPQHDNPRAPALAYSVLAGGQRYADEHRAEHLQRDPSRLGCAHRTVFLQRPERVSQSSTPCCVLRCLLLAHTPVFPNTA